MRTAKRRLRCDKAGLAAGVVGKTEQPQMTKHTPPLVTGQTAFVLEAVRKHGPIPSFELTANCAIPEAAARIHNLRAMGFNVVTRILPEFLFRGRIRRNVALYSMGIPEWPRPGFPVEENGGQHG